MLCKVVIGVLVATTACWCHAQAPLPSTPGLESRVEAALAKMPLKEKLALLGGTGRFFTRPAPSVGLPQLKMSNGPVGLRTFGPATAYPALLTLAASWDTALAERVGASQGEDARARGVHFLLAPGVNIYRSPLNGRNMEYLGEDPYLAGRMAVGYIQGVQSKGVSATLKHFAANNSDFDRHNINAIIDERTLREIYLPAFEAAVKQGHVRSVMDSYNLVNGAHSSQNSRLNNDILKGEWGFDGLLMSDWTSTYDGVAAANGGLDLEMPFAKAMSVDTLKAALADGRIKQSTIDDKVRRLLRITLQFGWMDRALDDISIPWNRPESGQVALDQARESFTLLKNESDLLPLDARRMKTIAIIGPDAATAVVGGGGSSNTIPFQADSIVTGFTKYLGDRVKVVYVDGLPAAEDFFTRTTFAELHLEKRMGNGAFKPVNEKGEESISRWHNHLAGLAAKEEVTYRWTGKYLPTASGDTMFLVGVNDPDTFVLKVNGKIVVQHSPHPGRDVTQTVTVPLADKSAVNVELEYRTRSMAPHVGLGIRGRNEILSPTSQELLRKADAVLLAVGFDADSEGEGADRTYALPLGQNELIDAVTSANPRTIVALMAGGSVETAPWIEKVPALIDIYYPGEAGARALAEIIFGERSPEGHLPFSWEKELSQNPASAHYEEDAGTKDSHYAEGLYLGYRFYTTRGQQPLFPFGYGLSYTTFEFSKLAVKTNSSDDVELSFQVRNTGKREGATVAQVYVGDPSAKIDRPAMELKQFAKVRLAANGRQKIVLHLDRRAFSYYDVAGKFWKVDPGIFSIMVGESSAKIELKKEVLIQ